MMKGDKEPAYTHARERNRRRMEIERISDRNYMVRYRLEEWDLNLHFITGVRYNFVVDTGLGSESVAPIIDFLKDSARPTLVVNTHHHWDHLWGNHCFSGPILAHRRCRQLAAEHWDDMLRKNRRYIRGEVARRLPDLVFEDEVCFPEDGVRIFYTPGHTADSVSVYDEVDHVLDAGDNIGDTVDDILPSIETDKETYAATLRRYRELAVDACVSGHNIVLGAAVFDAILNQLDAT